MSPRFRDNISQPLTIEYFHQRLAQGWVVTAIEWARPALEEPHLSSDKTEPIPYGRQVSADCMQLVEQAGEMEVVAFIYDGIIGGLRPPYVAIELNKRGYRTREGLPWTPTAVFDLMPRIIELSPQLQQRPDWPHRRSQLNLTA